MKSNEDLIKEGKELRTLRKLMGIKQTEMAKQLKTKPSNYCNMELGRLNSGNRILHIRNVFDLWRKKELVKLNNHIKYLKSL